MINDQDAVARSGKLFGMFKRAGGRVFLDQKGDMLVCPMFLEAALWRKLGHTSVRHHMLAAYLKVRVQQLFACYLVMTSGLWAAKVSWWAPWHPQTRMILKVGIEHMVITAVGSRDRQGSLVLGIAQDVPGCQ